MIKHGIDLAVKPEVCRSRRSLTFRWFISMREKSGACVCMGLLEDAREETRVGREVKWRCEENH